MYLSVFALFTGIFHSEAMNFDVQLNAPRYVVEGGSALLQCNHSVDPEQLHRVEWLSGSRKLFQYIKGRTPPFRNHSILGAQLDWSHSNQSQILLKNINFDATGVYSCEVSTDSPIFTKPSNDADLTVIAVQGQPPQLSLRRPVYRIGDILEANCTTSPSKPTADITWLINGNMAEEAQLKFYPEEHSDKDHLSAATVQLSLQVEGFHVGAQGTLDLNCLSTIPPFRKGHDQKHEYADMRSNSIIVKVEVPANKSSQHRVLVLLFASLGTLFFRVQ